MKTGFIYIWKDKKRNKYYIGSHQGTLCDGYIGSSKRFKTAYLARPDTFRRKILECVNFEHDKELRLREEIWLKMIKPEELCIKYYNEKRVAAGGDIISELSEEKRKIHKEKSLLARKRGREKWLEKNPNILSEHGKRRRAKVKNPSGGSMPGETNPFFGKKHTEETKRIISEKNKIKSGNRRKTYEIIFSNDRIEIFDGYKSIAEKYCKTSKIKFSAFVDSGLPISSNRTNSADNELRGALIRTYHENL